MLLRQRRERVCLLLGVKCRTGIFERDQRRSKKALRTRVVGLPLRGKGPDEHPQCHGLHARLISPKQAQHARCWARTGARVHLRDCDGRRACAVDQRAPCHPHLRRQGHDARAGAGLRQLHRAVHPAHVSEHRVLVRSLCLVIAAAAALLPPPLVLLLLLLLALVTW